MKKIGRHLWWILGLPAAALGGTAYLKYTARREPEVRHETQAVDRGPVAARITATGTLAPLKTVLVGSQISGRIADLYADFDSEVRRGQVIARLDPQLLRAALESARANLSGARASLRRAQALAEDAARQRDRARSLAERKLVAQPEADTAASGAEAAAAQVIGARGEVEKATAAVHQAELNLAYATITSPIDEAAGEALANARVRLRLAEARFAEGVCTAIELGDAQVEVTRAAAQVVQARTDLALARAQLGYALGRA